MRIICFSFVFIFLHFQVDCSSFPSSSPPDSVQLCSAKQSIALLKFKKTFPIAKFGCETSYPKIDYWNESTDCCLWDGVTCDNVTGNVIGLDLSCISGAFPANSSLFLLTHLQWLNLRYNYFGSSPIPSKFGELVNLSHLNLSTSGFSGIIPSEISHMSKLVSLDLSYNYITIDQLTFNLLAHSLTKLRDLRLDVVDMSSVIPSSLLNLSSTITSLSLKKTGLPGNLPEDVFRFPYLKYLVLSENANLSGYLPKSNWSNPLRLLDLSGTSFSGELPDSIGNLKQLQELQLNRCNFIGSIPVSLANLTQLISLDLSYNNLQGQIPNIFLCVNRLTNLDLSRNSLSGQLPSSAFTLTGLSWLDFSHNQLAGQLPYQVSGLLNLTKLQLNDNSISGRVPSWLFTLPSLEGVNLSSNNLTGLIDHFKKPNSIRQIYLENNNILGPIPDSVFELVSLTSLHLSSNNLSGTVDFDMLSKLRNLETIDLSHNSLLSLSSSNSDVNFTLPKLHTFLFSSCNIREFPHFLRTLESLYELDLSNNKIRGRISKWESEGWQKLSSLDLSDNLLTGVEHIPGRNLQYINLRSNLIEGSLLIPPPSTMFFLISNNKLTGEIPSSICNLSSLSIIDLSNNDLSGTIPRCLANVSYALSIIDLNKNRFHGSIPNAFMFGSNLRNLELNGNLLEGSLPQSLVNCTNLLVLDVGNNRINDSFPSWLGTLPKLQILILRSNKFHGSINNPANMFPFPMLRVIDLSDNKFSGILPTRFFESLKAIMSEDKNKSESESDVGESYIDSVIVRMKGFEYEMVSSFDFLTTIDFSQNHFNGHIPDVVGMLASLVVLNFSHNSLTGDIPSSFGNMRALQSLDLSWNKLVGRIPTQLTDLTFLAALNLSQNQLVGPIPRGRQFETFENDSYRENLGLCGYPLSEKCSTDEPSQPPSPSTVYDEDDSTGGFDWKFAMIGYGSGLVFGISLGYIVFATGKPWWFVRMMERERYKRARRTRQRRGGRRNR